MKERLIEAAAAAAGMSGTDEEELFLVSQWSLLAQKGYGDTVPANVVATFLATSRLDNGTLARVLAASTYYYYYYTYGVMSLQGNGWKGGFFILRITWKNQLLRLRLLLLLFGAAAAAAATAAATATATATTTAGAGAEG